MALDVLNQVLNWVAPPATLFSFLFVLPPLYLFRAIINLLSTLNPEDMRNKVVVITGASSGIGEQMAYEYAKRGASLVLVARREDRLRAIADRAKELGSPDTMVIPADVSKADECRGFVEATINNFGRIDHLVNNAGIMNVCMFEDLPDLNNMAPIMDINFWGVIHPTYYALPHLKKMGGRVVVMSSGVAHIPHPRQSFYNASKAAVMNFYETLRIELGSEVGVTIASPAWIESEMTLGKFLSKEGQLHVDQEMRDVQFGPVPVANASSCAREVVDAACRGKKYVTVPFWFRLVFLYRFLAPEAVDFIYRLVYVRKSWGVSSSERETLSKTLLDVTGAKKFLYPSLIRQPQTTETAPAPATTSEPTKLD